MYLKLIRYVKNIKGLQNYINFARTSPPIEYNIQACTLFHYCCQKTANDLVVYFVFVALVYRLSFKRRHDNSEKRINFATAFSRKFKTFT